jgi:hypothetical protein
MGLVPQGVCDAREHEMKRRFRDLTAPEVLALAVSLEEEDARIFQEFAWIRKRYMESPFATSLIQVVVGGLLVFLAEILIGSG